MPTVLQFRRGTTAQNNAFTGSAGELSIDTTIDTIRIHDGSTAGGFEVTQNTATQTLTNKTLTSPVLNTSVSGTAVLDEDDMSSDSATQLATQQSIKAYVDTQVATIPVGDITAVTAGTGLSGGGTTGDVTLTIDSTVTTLTGSQTLTNKTLTSPTINSGTVGTALTFNAQADARFADSDSSNWVAFQAPATIASNVTWTLPSADAAVSGYALVSDASGTLSWAAAGATITSDTSTDTDFLLYFASTTTGALTAVKQDSGLTYNPSTGLLTSAAFSGSGASLTALNGSNISTGTVAAARVATLNQNTTGTAGGFSSAVTVSLSGDVTGSATFTSAGDTASITTTIAANSVALGTDTTGNYVGTITGGTGIASTGGTSGEGVAHTLSVDLSELTDMTAAMTGTDEFIVLDAGADRRKAANEIGLSIFNNDAGFTTNTGDITGVTAGTGLNGGGSSGSVTLNVDLSELTDMTATMTGTDEFIVLDASADRRKAANEIGLSIFNNDAGFTTNTGDITNVSVSGTGLSGGGASGSVTITSNATNANTGSTIVARDGSGNFSAGVITATATQARYADLAEKYTSDQDYEPGTIVELGGEYEVTQTRRSRSTAIAGVVSTDPAYLMNSDSDGISVALIGRVPCKVIGQVRKGDMLISSDEPGHAQAYKDIHNPPTGSVIGKAIENKDDNGTGVIEVLVGRL